jgi:hypothetical protein
MDGPLVAQDDPRLAAWSSGMTLASRARSPGVNSRSSPLQPREENAFRHCAKMDTNCAETRDRIRDLQILRPTLSQLCYRGCCEGQGALTALGQARRPMLCHCSASGWPRSGVWKTEFRLAFRRPSALGGGWTRATVSAQSASKQRQGTTRKASRLASRAHYTFDPRSARGRPLTPARPSTLDEREMARQTCPPWGSNPRPQG